MEKDFNKVKKVVKSCKTPEQLKCSEKMCILFDAKYTRVIHKECWRMTASVEALYVKSWIEARGRLFFGYLLGLNTGRLIEIKKNIKNGKIASRASSRKANN